MAYTQVDLDAIDAAIANGILLVTYEDRTVRYRNLSEMLDIRRIIADGLASSAGTPRYGRSYASFSKG